MFRDQPEAPLLIVTPTDRAEAILARARSSNALRVQILVPDAVEVLRDSAELTRLAEGASHAGLELLLITRDEATLALARRLGMATLAVAGNAFPASVVPPRLPASAPAPLVPAPVAPAPLVPAPPASAPPAPPPPAASADHAFLAALDDLDLAPRTTPEADLAAADVSLAAALRASAPPKRPTLSDEALLAASLQDEPEATAARVPPPTGGERAPSQRSQMRPTPPRREASWDEGHPVPARRAGVWLTLALTVMLVGLLAIIGMVLLAGSRVTIAVTPPVRPETIDLIMNLPLPLVAPGSGGSSAVAAAPLRDEVIFSMEGEVTEGTMAPAGSAGGVVTIYNSTQQAIFLPAGSEFTALRSDGREVPFVSVADVQVPPSTTSDTGAQVITSRGEASVTLQARSAGSGSNVEDNSVRRITPLGGAAFSVGAGALLIQHGPLVGGSEEEVRIVKDRDVEALLAPALEDMDSLARQRLDALAQAQQLVLDPSTIAPQRSELEQLRGFEYEVQPALGESLDPSAPRFTLLLSAEYSALATQEQRPLEQQLGMALTEQLRQAGRIAPGDCRAPSVNAWRWDGESLLVNGQITPDNVSPGCRGGEDAQIEAQVRDAVRGQSRAAAQANLDAMVDAGLIGSYTLPEGERMPRWDWQIEVQW